MNQKTETSWTTPLRQVAAALGTGPAEIAKASLGALSVSTVRSIYYRGVTPGASVGNAIVEALRKIARMRADASVVKAEPMPVSSELLWPAKQPERAPFFRGKER
jgi:hypothetical protein